MKKRFFVCSFCLMFCFTSFPAGTDVEISVLEAIMKTPSPTGYEENMAQVILNLLPDGLSAERDGMGSLYAVRGGEGDRLTLVTGIDEIGYFVSGFDERGYLNLYRAVSAPHGLFDSFQFGHPMTVWTEKGPVAGVLTIPSLHIASREMRNGLQGLLVIENAPLDIGVGSPGEAKGRGVAMLDPVTPPAKITHLAGQKKSGPSLGTKVCTALLVELAGLMEPGKDAKPVTFAWLAQTKFPARRSRPRAALGAVAAREKLALSSYLIIDTYPIDPEVSNGITPGQGPVFVTAGEKIPELGRRILQLAASESLPLQKIENRESMTFNAFLSSDETAGLFVPLKFPSTPNEIVDFRDVDTLAELISLLLR